MRCGTETFLFGQMAALGLRTIPHRDHLRSQNRTGELNTLQFLILYHLKIQAGVSVFHCILQVNSFIWKEGKQLFGLNCTTHPQSIRCPSGQWELSVAWTAVIQKRTLVHSGHTSTWKVHAHTGRKILTQVKQQYVPWFSCMLNVLPGGVLTDFHVSSPVPRFPQYRNLVTKARMRTCMQASSLTQMLRQQDLRMSIVCACWSDTLQTPVLEKDFQPH